MNILAVVAHHDDLELGCGAAIAKFIDIGHKVYGLVLTDSKVVTPQGVVMRESATVLREAEQAASLLGYNLLPCGGEDAIDIAVSDRTICKIISAIETYQI